MFDIKKIISKTFNLFGYEIQKNPLISSNVKEPFYHFRRILFSTKSPIIFDIGAYVGDTVALFKTSFSNSSIHAFEPLNESFIYLQNRFKKTDNVFLNNIAVGSNKDIKQMMFITKSKGSSSLLEPEKNANELWSGDPLSIQNKIEVETTTIDYYCQKNNIKEIHILKIDVQGSEFEVLKGAEEMLSQKKIKLIFTEVSIAPNYLGQTDLDVVIKFLKNYNYKIFNFFKMRHKNGRLIECDILFTRN